MKVEILVYLLLPLVFAKQAVWQSTLLKQAQQNQAVCSDGSSPIYFKSTNPKSKVWLLYLRGGAGCSN